MSKVKWIFLTILAATLVLFLSGGALAVSAEEEVTAPQDVTAEETEEAGETAKSIEDVVSNFVDWLKLTFGSDYEYYYNQIIDNWGSIEEYLLQFGEDSLPEQYQTGWQEFVSWLGEYSVIWAPVLAVAIVILVYIIGKKRFENIVKKVVDGKISAVGTEMNKQSKALTSIMHSQKALLGTNCKFEDNVKELEASEKELNS